MSEAQDYRGITLSAWLGLAWLWSIQFSHMSGLGEPITLGYIIIAIIANALRPRRKLINMLDDRKLN